MNEKAVSWAKKQISILGKEQKQNRMWYTIFSYLLSLINLSVVTLASIAISILLRHSTGSDSFLKIAMASAAAAVSIILFILNIVNMIYRGMMKWDRYRKAIDKIQLEYIKYYYSRDAYATGTLKDKKDKLEHTVQTIYDEVINDNHHKKLSKLIFIALSGGENA